MSPRWKRYWRLRAVGLRRPLMLAYLDLSDTLKPPVFDLLVFTLTFMSAIVCYIQLYSSGSSLALNVLSPVLVATALYLALRSAGGLAFLISTRSLEVYMAYPLSRRGVAGALLLSRVIGPGGLLISLPAVAAALIYLPVVRADLEGFLAVYAGFLVQALFYGLSFALIALASKNSGSAGILSLIYYFTYNLAGFILATISSTPYSLTFKASQAMSFYLTVYQWVTMPPGSPMRPGLGELLAVPLATLAIGLLTVEYLARWFEP